MDAEHLWMISSRGDLHAPWLPSLAANTAGRTGHQIAPITYFSLCQGNQSSARCGRAESLLCSKEIQ
jgi:hypothetical protein